MNIPPEFEREPELPRCWAFGTHGRCENPGGHSGNHVISFFWDDTEVINPAVNVPVVSLPVHDSVLVDLAVAGGGCYSCGCSEADHLMVGGDGEAMCVKHQCRSYLP